MHENRDRCCIEGGGLAAVLLAALALCLAAQARAMPHQAVWIVTAEEAAEWPLSLVGGRQESSAGPQIEIASPSHDSTHREAFPVEIRFHEGPSGRPVDTSSLRVIYQRAWGIDITGRLRAYVTSEGIRVPAASLPPGRHRFEIYLEDVDDNVSVGHLTVTVLN